MSMLTACSGLKGALCVAVVALLALVPARRSGSVANVVLAPPGCTLDARDGAIKHLIYLQFDNVHLTRDNPNVPSDLEQMPNLLNFFQQNGVISANQHTPLIAHTATDILTALTGVYPDKHGVAVSNSYRTFSAPGDTSKTASAFGYWTAPVSNSDSTFNMLSAPNTNAPAPWVPFTRAGCDVGAVGLANLELENAGADISTVFGADSPEAAEAKSNSGQASANYVGVAVHCAQGDAVCSTANHGVADALPDEPHGYSGFNALFGHKEIAPQLSPGGPLLDLNGNPIIDPKSGFPGFPGFDGLSAAVSLGYVAAMQEHGIPVSYAYIADAHDDHASGKAFGPGEGGYVAQLRADDQAFGAFFARLASDGITRDNALFVVTADEGDHFTGGPPAPVDCDGVTTPCTYNQIGEVAVNLSGLLATQQSVGTPFAVHADTAPVFYLDGNPAQDDPATRQFEQAVAALHGVDPLTGADTVFSNYLADQAELRLLHMVSADPARTPSFVMFAKSDFFLAAGAANCDAPCIREEPSAAWDHGSIAPEIDTTWLGLAGPGVQHLGRSDAVWSDHADIRPTILALLGLRDDYAHDGRVLVELLSDAALPPALHGSRDSYVDLATADKQIDAPLGALALDSLRIATAALASNSPNDTTYSTLEAEITAISSRRDALAARVQTLLDADVNDLGRVSSDDGATLAEQARQLIAQVHMLADAAAP
jgi:hypothetical protein